MTNEEEEAGNAYTLESAGFFFLVWGAAASKEGDGAAALLHSAAVVSRESGAEQAAATEGCDAAAAEPCVLNSAETRVISNRKHSPVSGDTGVNGSSSPPTMPNAGCGAAMRVCLTSARGRCVIEQRIKAGL